MRPQSVASYPRVNELPIHIGPGREPQAVVYPMPYLMEDQQARLFPLL
jgi:hypothetical protein